MEATTQLLQIMPWLPVVALVMFRLTGFVLAAPFFSGSSMPVRFKGAFVVMTAVLISPLVSKSLPADLTLTAAVLGGLGELAIGLSIGFAVMLMFSATEWAGLVFGQQGGFALGEVFNPALEEHTSVTGQLYGTIFALVFLAVGGHREAIAALLDTYQRIPPLSFQFDERVIALLLEMLVVAFVFAVRLAGPILIALFLAECALAVLSRAIPQLNILTIGFALRAMLGVSVAAIVLSSAGQPMIDLIVDGTGLIREAFDLPPSRGWVN